MHDRPKQSNDIEGGFEAGDKSRLRNRASSGQTGDQSRHFRGGGHSKSVHNPGFTTSFKDFVNGEVAFENEIPAVLDLRDGVEAGQAHLLAFFLGELWSQEQGPVIELFANGR